MILRSQPGKQFRRALELELLVVGIQPTVIDGIAKGYYLGTEKEILAIKTAMLIAQEETGKKPDDIEWCDAIFKEAEKISQRLQRNQSVILPKLQKFCELYPQKDGKPRDPEFIAELKEGHCSGFSGLAAKAMFLQTKTSSADAPVDNWDWYERVITKLATWDGVTRNLSEDEVNDIERFLSNVVFRQKLSQFQIPQGDFDKESEMDTTAKDKVHCYYRIGSRFTRTETQEIIGKIVEAAAHTDSKHEAKEKDPTEFLYIFVTIPKHDLCIVKSGKDFYIQDSLNPSLVHKFADIKDAAEFIFLSNRLIPNLPTPIGLRVYGYDKRELDLPLTEFFVKKSAYYKRFIQPSESEETTWLEEKNSGGESAAFTAAHVGDSDTAKLFATIPVDCLKLTDRKSTALRNAISQYRSDIVKIIIEANPDLINDPENILHAVRVGNYDAVSYILKLKPNADVVNENKETLVHMAAARGLVASRERPGILEKLLEYKPNLKLYNNLGYYSLHEAVVNRQINSIKVLLQNGMSIEDETKHGERALHLAAQKNLKVMFEFILVECKADINSTTRRGETALHIAANNNNATLVNLLLKNNAKTDILNTTGNLALHVAVDNGFVEVVDVFLKHNPKLIDARNEWGSNALHVAAKKNNFAMVKLLLDHGASPIVKTDLRQSAVELTSDPKIREMLVQAIDKISAPALGTAGIGKFARGPTPTPTSATVEKKRGERPDQ